MSETTKKEMALACARKYARKAADRALSIKATHNTASMKADFYAEVVALATLSQAWAAIAAACGPESDAVVGVPGVTP